MQQKLILWALRSYLNMLVVVAPQKAAQKAYRLFSTPRSRKPIPQAAQPIMQKAEKITLTVDGLQVVAYHWLHPKRRVRSAVQAGHTVFLAHGWESCAGRLTSWVEPLLAANYSVVAVDAPAHGDSAGSQCLPLLFAKALIAAEQRIAPATAIVGHSWGGLSAALACSEMPLLEGDHLQAGHLIVIAGSESGHDALDYFCQFLGLSKRIKTAILDLIKEDSGYALSEFDVSQLLQQRPIPTLWFHDPADKRVPYSGAKKAAQACTCIQLREKTDLGHHKIARDSNVIQAAIGFLQT